MAQLILMKRHRRGVDGDVQKFLLLPAQRSGLPGDVLKAVEGLEVLRVQAEDVLLLLTPVSAVLFHVRLFQRLLLFIQFDGGKVRAPGLAGVIEQGHSQAIAAGTHHAGDLQRLQDLPDADAQLQAVLHMVFQPIGVETAGDGIDGHADELAHLDIQHLALFRHGGIICVGIHDVGVQLQDSVPHGAPLPGAPGIDEMLFDCLLIRRPLFFHSHIPRSFLIRAGEAHSSRPSIVP